MVFWRLFWDKNHFLRDKKAIYVVKYLDISKFLCNFVPANVNCHFYIQPT